MAKQTEIPGVVPPLTEEQDLALSYALALDELDTKKEAAEKRKEELLAFMGRRRKSRVTVIDSNNYRHTFETEEGKTKLKHNAHLERTTEKVEEDLRG